MKPWTVDADDLKLADDPDFLHRTSAIDEFLAGGNERFILVATKGFGKTLLLKAQRVEFQERGFTCLPENTLIDKPVGDKIFSKQMVQLFGGSTENWQRVWLISIVAASAKVLGLTEGLELRTRLAELIQQTHLRSPIDYFVNVIDFPRNDLFKVANEVDTVLIPRLRGASHPIAIFIDSIDEYFNKHLLGFASSDAGELSADIWYFAQMGLVETVYRLRRVTHHLKVFVSVRKEAFARFDQSTSMVQQYRGSTVDLSYGTMSLKEIFGSNVQRERKANLVDPTLQKSDPIASFLGLSSLTHTHTHEEESAFDYIRRHSLGRPRDLMSIGSRLSMRSPAERDPKSIRRAVNLAATEIAREYLNEIEPYTMGLDLHAVFRELPGNVLGAEQWEELNARFPIELRLMRNAGLIGRVEVDPATAEKRQFFFAPGERNLDDEDVLPSSSHYLIHSVLAEVIAAQNPTYIDGNDRLNIIGNGRPWRESAPERELFVLRGDVQGFSQYMKTGEGEEAVVEALEGAIKEHARDTLHAEVAEGDSVTIVHDDPSTILKAARRIMEDLHDVPGNPLLRMAIDRGRVRLKRENDQRVRAMGDPLRRAARIEAKVRPGEIWVTEEFKSALEKSNAFYRASPVSVEDEGAPDRGLINIKKTGSPEPDDWLPLFRNEG